MDITITNSTAEDIEAIFRLYRMASEYMRAKKTVVVWPEFDRGMVSNEITNNQQWKMLINGQIACIWATTFSDPQIWGERNADAAVYIHRIATDPAFRGRNFVADIVIWARQFAKANSKDYIRMDTIGDNKKLITHYTNAGFAFIGSFELKEVDTLPEHYSQGPACLFEIKVS